MLLVALVLGTALSYLLGLSSLGRGWHVGIGIAGVVLSWAMLWALRLPPLPRGGLNGWTAHPAWAGAFIVSLVVGVLHLEKDAQREG